MPLSRRVSISLSILVILPIGLTASYLIAANVVDMVNPCIRWGYSGPISIVQGGPCSSGGARPETILRAIFTTSLFEGGMLLGALLGVFGAITQRRTPLIASFVILSLESAPLLFDGLFVFTLPPAGFFLWGAKTQNSFR